MAPSPRIGRAPSVNRRTRAARQVGLALAFAATALVAGACAGSASGGRSNAAADAAPAADASAADPLAVSPENRAYARRMLEAIEIRGHSRAAIEAAIEARFEAAGMRRMETRGSDMVFERGASRGERSAYGSWHGDDLVARIRVDLISVGGNAYLARSRSSFVRNPGGLAEDEQPMARGRAREYDGLLRAAAEALGRSASL